jgi:hypothetical protein
MTFADHNKTFVNLHKIFNKSGLHLAFAGYKQLVSNLKVTLMGGVITNQRPAQQGVC